MKNRARQSAALLVARTPILVKARESILNVGGTWLISRFGCPQHLCNQCLLAMMATERAERTVLTDDSTIVTVPRRRKRRRRGSGSSMPAARFSVAATSTWGDQGRSHGPTWGVCAGYCCCCRRGHSADTAAGYPKWRQTRCRLLRRHSISLMTSTAGVVPLPLYWSRGRLQHTSRPI